ncbi:hypothetical protein Vretimale_4483 [Volvox reticuliferus]|uniref:Uncharacterized protein n=1 Tax=Volvox reticuliferus TaxID=1737510 RepID=A0A8J4FJ13_9CHLO|nr:hypothetical protein Vretifemale_3089 [Volvox reticuliferus]GIL99260.1 hypothetical protein Vretimale_4483 [Volvox reticuliferus]
MEIGTGWHMASELNLTVDAILHRGLAARLRLRCFEGGRSRLSVLEILYCVAVDGGGTATLRIQIILMGTVAALAQHSGSTCDTTYDGSHGFGSGSMGESIAP